MPRLIYPSVANLYAVLLWQFTFFCRPQRGLSSYAMGGTIKHGGGRACYIPSLDQINLPEKESFNTSADYYATAYHELIHYTGAEKRLARLKNDSFGSEGYAFEELIAELGASMLCAYNGINAQLQHASYIDSWIKALRGDKKFIISASAKAQKAVNYLLNVEGEGV
jgi:antirestriction protein ArdC